jgi:TolA-binding protein
VEAEDISELQGLVKNNPGTAAAVSARILLAEKQWEDGQQDDAIRTLETFVAEDASHTARPSALASLASKLLSQGKKDEAEEMFNEITSDPDAGYIAPYAWIMLGDIRLAKGDKDAAAQAYETVEREHFDSPFHQQAMERRLLLKAAPPVEVAANITVPDSNLTGEDDVTAPGVGQADDLIEAIKGGIEVPDSNPLLPDQADPE